MHILLCLFCQHSYNDFEKGVSLRQGPSSLAGLSCYFSVDFDGDDFNMVLDFSAIQCLKVSSLPLSPRETCGVGKNLTPLIFDFRSYEAKKLSFQCPGSIVSVTPSRSVEK